jgi:LacI family transcriptional regulator
VPPNSTPPTLREIARRAGVSHTAVSLALRNDPSLPARTRARLRRLADTMGYRPNVLVSALMTQVRRRNPQRAPEVLGFLTGGATGEDWRNHSASVGFFEGAQRRAQELGMRMETFWLGMDGVRAAEICRILRTRSIRGNLITPFPVPVYPTELDWAHLVCVALGYAFKSQPLHRATHHHFRGSFTALENLVQLGYGRIGLLLDEFENSRVGYAWLGGYLSARQVHGVAQLEPLILADPGDSQNVRRWLDRERPDAVIGFGPRQLRSLQAAGKAIPRDVAFAALDVQQTNLAALHQVSGIDQNLPLIGATAIDILAGQLYHNEHGLPQRPMLSMIEGFWVDGKTAPRKVSARSRKMIARESR